MFILIKKCSMIAFDILKCHAKRCYGMKEVYVHTNTFCCDRHSLTIHVYMEYSVVTERMSAWLYRITTKYSFIQYIHNWFWKENIYTNSALQWEIDWFETIYLFIRVWRRLSSELTSTAKLIARADGRCLCSIPQRLHLTHKEANLRIWIYSKPNECWDSLHKI